MKVRMVVCAAVRYTYLNDFGNRRIRTLIGPRHYDKTMHHLYNDMIIQYDILETEQGFIDQFGVFMTREEAWEVAKAAEQIRYNLPCGEGVLYSEHLY